MSAPRSAYIVGPAYDWAFFLLPPLVSLAIGVAVAHTAFTDGLVTVAGRETTWASVALGTVIHAHLVAVFVRSHGNAKIRALHPVRFFVVPALLWLALVASDWLAVTATVVATFWDVWHSGAQTFGFGRIYDRNQGSDPRQGRWLDYGLNQLLYAGPILGGVTLVDHLVTLDGYADLGTAFFTAVPARAASVQRLLAWIVLAAGAAYLVVYAAAYVRLHRRGYRVSPLKITLFVTTGACSIYTWGFNTWGEAFLIMNLFHAVQYLAMVWATERRNLEARLRLARPGGGALTCAIYLGAVLAYGLGAELLDPDVRWLWAGTLVVSLMHFWYDGFIWSVARRQV
jgi:hypothetical protein